MKKLLLTFLLAFAAYGFAQEAQGTAPAQTTPGQQPTAGQQTTTGSQQTTGAQQAAQPQQKTIKDPAEYNAYMSAISAQDPAAKAQALEAFLQLGVRAGRTGRPVRRSAQLVADSAAARPGIE